MSGGDLINFGSISNHCAHKTRNKATDVRELASTAIVRTAAIGRLAKTATDATGPSDVIATSGTI